MSFSRASFRPVAGVITAVVAVACGGSVVFVEDGEEGGGGEGGTGGFTTNGPTTTGPTTNGPTTTGPTTTGPTTTGPTTTGPSTDVATSVTTGGSQICTFPDLSDLCQSCVEQSINGPVCADRFEQCFEVGDCGDYDTCIFDCDGDIGCCQSCTNQMPQVAAVYAALVECVFCNDCAMECPEGVQAFCGP